MIEINARTNLFLNFSLSPPLSLPPFASVALLFLFFSCPLFEWIGNCRKHLHRPGSQSPPLPPPPPEEDENQHFGRPRTQSVGPLAPIVPDDQNLPGWVPKNYIEKGNKNAINNRLLFLSPRFHFSSSLIYNVYHFQLLLFTITMRIKVCIHFDT